MQLAGFAVPIEKPDIGAATGVFIQHVVDRVRGTPVIGDSVVVIAQIDGDPVLLLQNASKGAAERYRRED